MNASTLCSKVLFVDVASHYYDLQMFCKFRCYIKRQKYSEEVHYVLENCGNTYMVV